MKDYTPKLIVLLATLSFVFCSCTHSNDTSYYVDASNGNDSNTGLSPKQAFASLQKVNELVLTAGNQVLFKSGTSYTGQLKPQGKGSQGQPIIISKYGGEAFPIIQAEGQHLSAVHLYNIPYIELRQLEITNTGAQRANKRRGVTVEAKDFGVLRHTILDQLYIHDVNGSLVKSDGGGSAIIWQNHGKEVITTFDSLIIQNCHLENCSRNGINARGYTRRDNWHPSTNVIIRHNLLEGIPGDGIVPIGTDGAVIEYNVMRNCPDILSHKEAAAGIWPWSADNTLIQFNEVSGHKAKWDGQGFDSDWNCINTTIQYNYSHDNYGGFLLVCNNGGNYKTTSNKGTYNTIVRYNISVNDGIRPYPTERRGWFSPAMHISGPVENTLIHHNLFIFPEKKDENIDHTFIRMDNWGGPWPKKTLLSHNVMDFSEAQLMFYGESKGTSAQYNSFDREKMELKAQEITPQWAAPQLETIDSEFAEKLKAVFFEDNEAMQEAIDGLLTK